MPAHTFIEKPYALLGKKIKKLCRNFKKRFVRPSSAFPVELQAVAGYFVGHESGNPLRWQRDAVAGRNRIPSKAHGANWGLPDTLAHHEDLRPLWA
jgi:hypothetical protein